MYNNGKPIYINYIKNKNETNKNKIIKYITT